MEAALASLAAPSGPASATVRQAHLALLKRWYYRPEARRTGRFSFRMRRGDGRSKLSCVGWGGFLLANSNSPPRFPSVSDHVISQVEFMRSQVPASGPPPTDKDPSVGTPDLGNPQLAQQQAVKDPASPANRRPAPVPLIH